MHKSPYDLATRLKYLRISNEINQSELAKMAGISQRQVSLYESGKSSPRSETVVRLASALDVSVMKLIYGDDKTDAAIFDWLSRKSDDSPRQVPLVTWAQAASKQIGPDDSFVYTPSWVGIRAFALNVHGMSMSPDYPPGSIIVVDPDITAQSGDDALVREPSVSEEPIFARLSFEQAGIMALVPVNPQYPATFVDESADVLGVVVMQILYRLNHRVENAEKP